MTPERDQVYRELAAAAIAEHGPGAILEVHDEDGGFYVYTAAGDGKPKRTKRPAPEPTPDEE